MPAQTAIGEFMSRERASESVSRGDEEKRREYRHGGGIFIVGDGGRHVGIDARRPLTR